MNTTTTPTLPTRPLAERAERAADRRLANQLLRIVDGPDEALVERRLLGRTALHAFVTMTPARRAQVIRPAVIEDEFARLQRHDEKQAAELAAAAARRAVPVRSDDAATASRYWVSCRRSCGAMVPTGGRSRPTLRACGTCVPAKAARR
jgi:hypothetical protein